MLERAAVAVIVVLLIADNVRMPKLTRKNDLICWVYLSDIQQRIYQDFLETPEVKEVSQYFLHIHIRIC